MKKILRYSMGSLITLLVLVLLALWFTPLSWLNYFAPEGVKLIGASGNVARGGWQAIHFQGKTLPLDCRYQRQSLQLVGATYTLTCQTPLSITAEISANASGEILLKNTHITGELNDLSAWLSALGIAAKPYAPIAVNIPRAHIVKQQLRYLQVDGQLAHFCPLQPPPAALCAYEIDITTLNPALSAQQPISIAYSSNPNKGVQFDANTQIDGISAYTYGEISGEALKTYSLLFNLLGRKINDTTLAVEWYGHW